MADPAVRPARSSDMVALAELARNTYAEAFGHSLSPGDLAAHLRERLSETVLARAVAGGDVILVAEVEGALVGFVQFARLFSQPSASDQHPLASHEIRRLYVRADHRNRGLGRRLMDAALDDPLLRHASAIVLDVWERNDGAQRFYERYGFTVVGAHRPDYASGPAADTDLIMVRRGRA